MSAAGGHSNILTLSFDRVVNRQIVEAWIIAWPRRASQHAAPATAAR
jgi:hypothetical protein